MANDTRRIQTGDVIAGKYTVEKVLGAGAMGVVVAARHVDLLELRAIKLMMPSALSNAESVERFLREARAAARLKNDYVVKIHDIGRLETGAPYLVMEHLDGCDLKSLIQQRGALPVTQAVFYALQVCEALAEAHAVGVIHRDLKPANLFLANGVGPAVRLKVLDFGIAKMLDPGAAPGAQLTQTAMALGSPMYMSPEQIRSTRDVDARTDIWSLGVVMYECLTGTMPFNGTTVMAVCGAICADAPRPLSALRPDVPAGLESVVMRCLEKDHTKRFPTASQLASAIAPFAGDLSASGAGLIVSQRLSVLPVTAGAAVAPRDDTQSTGPGAAWTQPGVPRPRRPWPLLAAIAIAFIVATGVGMTLRWRRAAPQATASHAVSTPVPVTASPQASPALPMVAEPPPPAAVDTTTSQNDSAPPASGPRPAPPILRTAPTAVPSSKAPSEVVDPWEAAPRGDAARPAPSGPPPTKVSPPHKPTDI